jgi:HK97 family phage portal protein
MGKLADSINKALHGVVVKHPTLAADYSAYASGANKTFDVVYNEYIQSVETIDRAIRVHANIFSLMKLDILKEDTKGELSELKVKNFDKRYPNEVDTTIDFLRKLGVSIFSQGAGVIIGETKKGMTQLYTVDVANIKIEATKTEMIKSFIYVGKDGSEITYKPQDVIYINDSIDPSNLVYSLSRLKSLNDVIQIQAGIVAKTKEMSQGGAKDSFIVSAENPMSKDSQVAIKQAFDTFIQSAGTSSLFLNTKLNYHQVGNSMNAGEMLSFFVQVNKMMLDHYNMPPALIGDYSASGANKNEELIYSLRVWFTTMMRPVIHNVELGLTRYFRNTLGLKNAVVRFNLHDLDILDDPIDLKVDRALKMHKAGLMSFNEARALCELDPINAPSADLHFLPQYLTGSAPITVENFDKEVERLLQGTQDASTDASTDTDSISDASGNAGGEDNTNVTTGSRGGNDEGI